MKLRYLVALLALAAIGCTEQIDTSGTNVTGDSNAAVVVIPENVTQVSFKVPGMT